MKKIMFILLLASMLVVGILAASALANNDNPGSPGDNCSHGNSNKECKPDPQPEHGKDCEDHGNARGNEDHCDDDTTTTTTDTTTTDTTDTTDTTTTTDTETTTDETATTVETETTPRCPPGMTPTAGKDGEPGNDECEYPPNTTTTDETETTTTPGETTEPEVVVTEPPTTTTTNEEEKPFETPPHVTKPDLEKDLDKQAKKNKKGAKPAREHVPNANELPYTGLPLWAVTLIGASLIGSGLYLRRV